MDTAKKSTTSTAETPAGQAPDALAETSADEMRAIDGVDSGNRVGSNPETFNRR